MMQLLADPAKAAGFSKLVFDMLKLAGWKTPDQLTGQGC
jgi:hypothetical protein